MNAAAVALGLLTMRPPRLTFGHPATEPIRAAADRARAVPGKHGANLSFLANQYAIQRSGCATTVVGTTKPAHLDRAIEAASTPIDENLLAAIGDVRGSHWISGLPENS